MSTHRLQVREVFWLLVAMSVSIVGCTPSGAAVPGGDTATTPERQDKGDSGKATRPAAEAAATAVPRGDTSQAAGRDAGAKSSAPATAAEARRIIDLRSLPRLNATSTLDESPTYLYYSARSSIPATAAFYTTELESRGWKEVPSNIPENPQYRDQLFTRDGFYLRLTLGASGDEGIVGISLANLGNVNLSNLPRLDNVAPHAASSPVNVNYETTQGMPEAVKFCREQLRRLGWYEYGDLYVNPPEVPHVKQLNFCQNGNRLMVSIIRSPQLPNSNKTIIAYMSQHMLPYDIVVHPGARNVKLDTIRGRAEYVTSASIDELVAHYRRVQPELGWTDKSDVGQVRADGASLYVLDEGELGFGIEIARKDGGTQVAIQRLSFASASEPDAAQPDASAVAAEDAPNADVRSAIDEAAGDLQKEIEATVRKQLKAVEDQLKEIDADIGIDLDIPTDILSGAESDDVDDNPLADLATAADALADDSDAAQEATEAAERAAEMRSADEALAKLDQLQTACTLQYGTARYSLPHVLALRDPDDGTPVVIFCQKPLNVGRAQRALAKGEGVSVMDLTGNDFPPSIEIRLQRDYVSFSCFVDGASINQGSSDFRTDFLAGSRRVRGSVSMPEPSDVFDKPFRFEATFDQDFIDAARAPEGGNSLDLIAADSNYELPVPEGSQVTSERSPYRASIGAQSDLPLATLLAFYRRELTQRGYQEVAPENAVTGDRATLEFAGPEGPLTVSLQQADGTSQIEVSQRNEARAKQDQVVPAAGQGLLILANAGDTDVTVTLSQRTIPLPAGKGVENPADAVKVPVLPGKHRITITAAGTSEKEEVTVDAGTTWGVIALPGGGALVRIVY